ncbi:MAG: hypothetical protein IPP13_18825 [Kouleothrix sp.]|jgi:hypothetical protein|nr:hypothetical protein [Kouleothrix sp.]
MKYTLPDNIDASSCYLVPVPAALIPLVAGALKHFEDRRVWHTDAEYEQAYNAFAALQACFMKLCAEELIESNNRLYRLLDTALFGRTYTVESTDPLVVIPELEPARSINYENDASVLGKLDLLLQLTDNALNGTETPNYNYAPSVKALLQEVITALQNTGSLDADMLAKLSEIALLVG